MELQQTETGFSIFLAGRLVLCHSVDAPFIYAGIGAARMEMYRGNFDIEDRLTERWGLAHIALAPDGDAWRLECRRDPGGPVRLVLRLVATPDGLHLSFVQAQAELNRIWLRLPAEPGEPVWGCGEQMSYFNLRGRRFPLWTSEPGVGRDKTTEITWRADVRDRAGGDYFTTNYPQPSFLTGAKTSAHVETTAYAVFDFRDPRFHELEIWAVPERLELTAADSFLSLVQAMAARFGHPPALPEWVYQGAIIGLKDGVNSFDRLDRMISAGVRVSALWCEDWTGLRHTSFGARLFWDWRWSPARYPDLPARIQALAARGLRFLGYVNPYLCVDGSLFPVAEALGHLARNAAGDSYRVDFGEFECGVIDLTSPAACGWFATTILRGNMMGVGLAGWMADFGEYLPIDTVLANGRDATLMHNAWPTLWAEVNASAIAAAGQTGETLFFMRAGYTGVQRHCALLWAGDQSVDFSRHDGLGTVICGALSSGLVGNTFHHSDIGGYTSLFGNVRTAELIQRWAEMAAFTPVMRTHEGNRPTENLQIDQDAATLAHFARMTRIYCHLAPYLTELVAEAVATGLPVQRPLFLHFENEPALFGIQDHYMYGADLLVAPVLEAGREVWNVTLPNGVNWIHVWSGQQYRGGARVEVAAPLGQPPVFWRDGSAHAALFKGLSGL